MESLHFEDVITIDSDILGGIPVFRGTRVPVSILFEYLQESTIQEFLQGYPQVTERQVRAVIQLAGAQFLQEPLEEIAA